MRSVLTPGSFDSLISRKNNQSSAHCQLIDGVRKKAEDNLLPYGEGEIFLLSVFIFRAPKSISIDDPDGNISGV